jgi:hypothetical protein
VTSLNNSRVVRRLTHCGEFRTDIALPTIRKPMPLYAIYIPAAPVHHRIYMAPRVICVHRNMPDVFDGIVSSTERHHA